MTLLVPSRRGFLTGLASVLAAPAVVRAASLMPVRALQPAVWYLGPISAIPCLNVQTDWLTLDDYAERILQPAIKRLAQCIIVQEEFNLRRSRDTAFLTEAEWPFNATS